MKSPLFTQNDEPGLSRKPGEKPKEIITDEQLAAIRRIQADPSEPLQMEGQSLGIPDSGTDWLRGRAGCRFGGRIQM
jgi:hypothetical protein